MDITTAISSPPLSSREPNTTHDLLMETTGTAAEDTGNIHWLISQISGKHLLDIGTGEGTLPLLLGREGFHVVGIDLDAEAINRANTQLQAESESVKSRIEFRNEDLPPPPQDPIFDTIILNDAIGHIGNVPRFLRRALAHLKEKGRLFLVTPFGGKTGAQYKNRFCLSTIAKLVQPYGTLDMIVIEEGYIRLILTKTATEEISADLPDSQLLAATETAALRMQDALQGRIIQLQQAYHQQGRDLQAAQQAKSANEHKLAMLQNELSAYQTETQKLAQMRHSQQAEERKLRDELELAETSKRDEYANRIRIETQHQIELRDIQDEQQAEKNRQDALLLDANRTIASLRVENQKLTEQLNLAQNEKEALAAPGVDRETWHPILTALSQGLGEQAPTAASMCLRLSTTISTVDPNTACLFSSIARHLLPDSHADKIHGFHLLKAGLPTQAIELFTPFAEANYPGASSGEQRKIDALLAGQEVPDTRSELRVAAIMDEFTHTCYAPECDLLPLTPENWEQELQQFRPQMLFIESAWRGKDDKWGPKVGHLSLEVRGILSWCKERQIPTVFWNKEDPVHFDTFLTTAEQFDIVCTTDLDCIGPYKAELGHDRVYFLPFACQPTIHNPIEIWDRKDAFCFAGAYYVRYPDRTKDLENFIEVLPDFRPLEIYDRNFGKDDPNYMFPDSYKPFIVGTLPPDQIDRAYKGYRFGINLNSVKNSQTMFARRVYELLGSNTITISNYSRGLKNLFGDLVTSSDHGTEILQALENTDLAKLRLAGLRKTMSEHTYGARLNYIARKVGLAADSYQLPPVLVLAYPRNEDEALALTGHLRRQKNVDATLLLFLDRALDYLADALEDDNIKVISAAQAQAVPVQEIIDQNAWGTCMLAQDYYGPHYLQDLLLATRYCQAEIICKAAHYAFENDTLVAANPEQAYRMAPPRAELRSALLSPRVLHGQTVSQVLTDLPNAHLSSDQLPMFAIDAYNYCKAGSQPDGTPRPGVAEAVNDLDTLDCGYPLAALEHIAETCEPAQTSVDDAPSIAAKELMATIKAPADGSVTWEETSEGLLMSSKLPDGKHVYLYQDREHAVEEICRDSHFRVHPVMGTGLNIQCVALFLDRDKNRLGHILAAKNKNTKAELPEGTAWIRLGLRVYASGQAVFKRLLLEERTPQPVPVLSKARHLVLTNHYPSWEDIYRNGFVHSRVKAYRAQGEAVDVFRLRPGQELSYHAFEGIDCMTGSAEQLELMLSQGLYDTVLVHFLDEGMWQVLEPYVRQRGLRVIVWVHGAEVQPWWRREYNYRTEAELEAAKPASDKRLAFWRSVLSDIPPSLHLVFVSQYFADEVIEDVGIAIPSRQYSIVHNPVDTGIFQYIPKEGSQRLKILSIRPFASAKYANDLSVQAILQLKEQPFFNELEFRIIGKGILFEELLAPLRGLANVNIEERFLSQKEIFALHKEYGVFLNPTRMDAQGVSRDEAMASGLVPVTTDVAAIPEFVDESCGFLAPPEDAAGLAAAIETLYRDPALFQNMSAAAAARVRRQSGSDLIIEQELRLFSTRQNQKDISGHDA